MLKESFSYGEYKNIIEGLTKYLPLMDYSEINKETEKFLVLRHDVEFSIERAYEFAKFEANEMGISTSYFVQLRNNAYNIFSKSNHDLINEIHKLGHKIGLHIYLESKTGNDYAKIIKNEIEVMENGLGMKIDRFSYHRPPVAVLEKDIRIEGIINPYNSEFFTYNGDDADKKLDVLYLAESNKLPEKRWPYGYPLDMINDDIKKAQLLTHAYEWSNEGYKENLDAFDILIKQKSTEFIETMKHDCQSFRKLYK
ncbi:hypothetical protein HOE31_03410 [bacterium]|jgi:hypothetical protein|nr:hypothetical protein [bacterium]MBT4121966.1 hypothetical protein [bacterium]MBT4335435.1 hypothetical protein [bacterium]MBT4495524.1 hypothetical protein [bacterium]MBT4764182.1 hypothetical protein [bacterium]